MTSQLSLLVTQTQLSAQSRQQLHQESMWDLSVMKVDKLQPGTILSIGTVLYAQVYLLMNLLRSKIARTALMPSQVLY